MELNLNTTTETKNYVVPARFRKIENAHILIWIIKDLCWATLSRTVGMIMIIPTLWMAIHITINNWQNKVERTHNLATIFWLTANITWMVLEFFDLHGRVLPFKGVEVLVIIPFLIGIGILSTYYIPFLLKKIIKK
ncbi:MAG: hypothetical protein ORN85_07995 [Sediminibacterium sp.]|nr:hypothetical protein [Sediminibacterium sp.]